MYFTSTPSLNSMEAIMKRPPGRNQRGGGRLHGAYPFRKADCDCRLCLYHKKRKAAPWKSARCWMSDSPAAQPLFMKPFMRHLSMQDISRFKNDFHISTTERMMPL